MKLQIKSRYNESILFEGEADNIRQLLEMAVENKINLNFANLNGADLRDGDLRGPNLVCADLSNADLRGTNLFCTSLLWANLSNADLRRANLRGADLKKANLSGADLRDANLSYTNLSEANLNGAKLPDAPKVENLDSKILKAIEEGDKLHRDEWNTCETTHCRARWAIHLAGEKGKELEERFGATTAGALIYHVSTGYIPDFYATDEEALEDIKKCAAKQLR